MARRKKKSSKRRMKGHKRGCRCAIHMRRRRKTKGKRRSSRRGRR